MYYAKIDENNKVIQIYKNPKEHQGLTKIKDLDTPNQFEKINGELYLKKENE